MASRRPILTDDLRRRAALDAGNRSMRAAGRVRWSVEDYDAAAREFDRLGGTDGE